MRRKQVPLVALIILNIVLSAVSSILGNLASSEMPLAFQPYLQYAWLAFIGVTFILIVVGVCQYLLEKTTNHSHLGPSRQHRIRLLTKVHNIWITGVLEHSLYNAVLIELQFREQIDAIKNPWHLVLRQPNQSARPLPPGTSIVKVYDESSGELLILGEPGSGKTTLLLELTRELLNRAWKEDTHPIPVVFNLSSWGKKRSSLNEWLSEELNTKYQVPQRIAKAWMNEDAILPLLDGLDEVDSAYRAQCVETINRYRQEHGLVPLTICCRNADYPSQITRLLLRNAVTIEPLTSQQIETYLVSAGERLSALRIALHHDPDLRELATTPLMLSILSLAYDGAPIEGFLAEDSSLLQRQQIFSTYVQRMLQRRSAAIHYPPQEMISKLRWLAKWLTQNSQTVFSFKDTTAKQFLKEKFLLLYESFVVGARMGYFTGLFLGLAFGLTLGLGFGWYAGLTIIVTVGFFVVWVIAWLIGVDLTIDFLELFSNIKNLTLLVVGLILELVVGGAAGLIVGFGMGHILILAFILNILVRILIFIIIVAALLIGALLMVDMANYPISTPLRYSEMIVLQLLIWHTEDIPLNFSRLLDYAAECILLRKVGNGHIFIHKLLLDYFASI